MSVKNRTRLILAVATAALLWGISQGIGTALLCTADIFLLR